MNKLSISVVFCFICISLVCILQSAFCAEQDSFTGIITADSVNVRSGPSQHFEIVIQLDKDQLVLAQAQEQDWIKIKLPRNSRAYVHRQYVDSVSGLKGQILADRVNVRAGQGTQYNVLGQLNEEDTVEIISLSGDWYEIYPLNDSCSAWVHKQFIKRHGQVSLFRQEEEISQQAQTLFDQAQLLEQNDISLDLALIKYKRIAAEFPQSLQAGVAQKRITNLEELLKVQHKLEPDEPPLFEGKIVKTARSFKKKGTHKLIKNKKIICYLKSTNLDLDDHLDSEVQIWGQKQEAKRSKYPIIKVDYIKELD